MDPLSIALMAALSLGGSYLKNRSEKDKAKGGDPNQLDSMRSGGAGGGQQSGGGMDIMGIARALQARRAKDSMSGLANMPFPGGAQQQVTPLFRHNYNYGTLGGLGA